MTKQPADLDSGLHTLCYRIDPGTLGELVVYPLTAEFLAAWDGFTQRVKSLRGRADHERFTPSYSALATALTAASNQVVRLFARFFLSSEDTSNGVVALMVSATVIDPWTLTTAVRKFEQLSVGDAGADTLAPLMSGIQPQYRRLSEFITTNPHTGVVQAPGWIFDAARWTLAARIAAEPMLIDGYLPVTFRLDTEGHLVAYDDALTRASKNSVGHATVHVSTKIITVPGATGLYLRLDAHVARHPYTWSFVKNVWLDRGDPALPIVKLPILSPYPAKGRDHPVFKGYTAEVVESCGLDPITLPTEFGAMVGTVRPIGKPRKHSIGKGPGVRFLFQLGQHVTRQLATPPLRYAKTPITVAAHITGPIPPDQLDDAIAASGVDRLLLVGLYSTPGVRRRMIDVLAGYSPSPDHPLAGIDDDTPVALTPRLSVVLHKAEALLAHTPGTRSVQAIPWLEAPDGTGVIAFAETEWNPEHPPEHDAKYPVRRALANVGVVVQFLNSNWILPKPRKTKVKGVVRIIQAKDEPAIAAGRDLLRQAGLIDNRLARATTKATMKGRLDRDATLVGIHIRQHTPRRGSGARTRLVICLVAIHASPDLTKPWHVETFSDQHQRWVPYRIGNLAYHTGDLGTDKLTREYKHNPKIRDLVEESLTAAKFDRDKPLVIFVDAQGCKGIWPGLNDSSFGTGLLPGATLAHPDLAVVRCANGDRVAQPTHRGHGGTSADPHQPDLPRASLYEHDEDGTSSWLLAQPTRTYRAGAMSARAGGAYTRWTVPDDKQALTGKDWHGLTAIEIAVAAAGSWPERHLAALTARLCQQAASWDDRTQSPTPLHLAQRPDLDHPQRAELPEEADEP
ncbi:RNaseH domain-containing protein [Nocardia sp. NPDC058658]|uniref:RNaseH domain-containing protein n=1 Tax=Nocardia sp. NPDC058658 TaxID=3346580 RepID=UPI003653B82C